jgi:3-hydroxyisobutyrate dehydrogenase
VRKTKRHTSIIASFEADIDMTIPQHTIGYIGLGNMGGPMAVRLSKAGYEVNIYGRNKDRLKPALAVGAMERASAKDVAARSDIVFLCLTDTAAVEDVVFGPGGVTEGGKPSALLIDTSTISGERTVAMAAELRKATGMSWMDAPVSGGTVGAREGTLSIFVGGQSSDFEMARPVLEHVGRNITLMGSLGAGQATKLINQIIVCCSVAMLAEACGLAERTGLNLAALPQALAGGRADSAALRAYWTRLANRDYASLSTVTSILKDIDLIQGAGRKAGAVLPLTATVREYYQLLSNCGYANEDLTALARAFGLINRQMPRTDHQQ